MNPHDLIDQLDEASRIIEDVRRQLGTRPTHRRRIPLEDDLPPFKEWERSPDRDKWYVYVDQLKFVIFRRHGLFYWYIHDRDLKRRIAHGYKGHCTARRARRCARGRYLRNEYQGD